MSVPPNHPTSDYFSIETGDLGIPQDFEKKKTHQRRVTGTRSVACLSRSRPWVSWDPWDLEVFTIQNGDFMMDFHGISLSTNGHFMGFDRGSMRLQLLFFCLYLEDCFTDCFSGSFFGVMTDPFLTHFEMGESTEWGLIFTRVVNYIL